MTSDENILKVEQYFQQNPTTSIRRAARALNMKRESLRIIVRYFVNLFPYKIEINQLLKPDALEKRKLFCQISSTIETKDLNVDTIWFSDEAHFWLNSYVNKQNYRFRSTEQPFITQSKPVHFQHLTVWAATSSHDIHFFYRGKCDWFIIRELT